VRFRGLPTHRSFRVILADPPWRYNDLGHTRRIDKKYPVLSPDEIKALPVETCAADDAVLFLWSTSPFLPDALSVMAHWGFTYKSSCVWDKEVFGMGHYWRIRHEFVLLGVRGKPGTAHVHDLPSVIVSRRGAHSRKPEELYVHIERMYPRAKRLELFARRTRPGWDSWGNEVKRGTTAGR
jgi:N6-adenosine-specific RNA methylase IME4